MTRMRTFIAIGLDDPVRRKATSLIDHLSEFGPDVKWVEPDTLHITLLFLGEVDVREIPQVCKIVRKVTHPRPPFEMQLSGVGGFPNLRRPRTVWLGVDEGKDEIIKIHDKIETAMSELGGFRREERAFTPHITLGRCKGDDLTPEMHAELTQQAEWHGGQQIVRHIQVLSSELTRNGPNYTILSREKLLGDDHDMK